MHFEPTQTCKYNVNDSARVSEEIPHSLRA